MIIALRLLLSATVLSTAVASPPAHAQTPPGDPAAPATVINKSAPLPWQNAEQLVLVITPDWNSVDARMQTFQYHDGAWRATHAPVPVTLGRNGTAWGRGLHPPQSQGPQKREGDGRAPAGVFRIGMAFGYAPHYATGLDYAPMQAGHYCIDVPDSPLYNRIVDAQQVGATAVHGSTEPMRRDLHVNGDLLYKKGFVIQHNPDQRRAAGSCIFAHLWRAPGAPTAGCTAMAEAQMDRLLAWLQHDRQPVFVLLPHAQYLRLRGAWHLPTLEEPLP